MAIPAKWDNFDEDLSGIVCTEGALRDCTVREALSAVEGAVWDPSDESIYVYGNSGVVRVRPGGGCRVYFSTHPWLNVVLAGPGLLVGTSYMAIYWLDFRSGDLSIQLLIDLSTEFDQGSSFEAMAISKDRKHLVVSDSDRSFLRKIALPVCPGTASEVVTLIDDNPKQVSDDGWTYGAVVFALDGKSIFVSHGTIAYQLDLATLELREMYRDCRPVLGRSWGYHAQLYLDRDGSLLVFGAEITRLSPLKPPVKRRGNSDSDYLVSLEPGPDGRLLISNSSASSNPFVKLLDGMTVSDADLRRAHLQLGGAFVGALLVASQRRPIQIVGGTLRSLAVVAVAAARYDIEATDALLRAYRFNG